MFTELRLSKGVSQHELSRRSGVSQTTISQIESGTRDTSMGTIRRLAMALEVSQDTVLWAVHKTREAALRKEVG